MQSHPTSPVTIYALRDPDTGEPAYVGQTARPLTGRLREHIQSRANNCARGRWIMQLHAQGKRPVIMALELTDEEHADERELFHIMRLRKRGHHLTNSSIGRMHPPAGALHARESTMDHDMTDTSTGSTDDPAPRPEGVSVAEAAAMLGLHSNTVRHRLKRGVYPHKQVLTPFGAAYEIPRAAIEAELALATQGSNNDGASNGASTEVSTSTRVVQTPRSFSVALQTAIAPLVAELARARAEAAAAHERAGRLQAERDAAVLERNVERTRRYEREQRRPWWRLW